MRPDSEYSEILLKFLGCREIVFSRRDDYAFYDVESVKVLKLSETDFYVSLDPFDESGVPLGEDNDIFRSRSIEFHRV